MGPGLENLLNGAMRADNKGYTFIELAVVILLVGLMMTLAVPKFRYAILTDHLKGTTRRLTGIMKHVRGEAIREQTAFFLHFDLELNRYWIDTAVMTDEERARAREEAYRVPEGVTILDVWVEGKDKQAGGETAIRFTKSGYVRKAIIHLGSQDGRTFTLLLRPFLARVSVFDRYVEPEDSL